MENFPKHRAEDHQKNMEYQRRCERKHQTGLNLLLKIHLKCPDDHTGDDQVQTDLGQNHTVP